MLHAKNTHFKNNITNFRASVAQRGRLSRFDRSSPGVPSERKLRFKLPLGAGGFLCTRMNATQLQRVESWIPRTVQLLYNSVVVQFRISDLKFS